MWMELTRRSSHCGEKRLSLTNSTERITGLGGHILRAKHAEGGDCCCEDNNSSTTRGNGNKRKIPNTRKQRPRSHVDSSVTPHANNTQGSRKGWRRERERKEYCNRAGDRKAGKTTEQLTSHRRCRRKMGSEGKENLSTIDYWSALSTVRAGHTTATMAAA